VYVPDLPGHGRSERPSEVLGIGDFAEVLSAWLEVIGLERPLFVASSMGCQIVTELAVQRPDRAGSIVLIGPTVDPSKRAARRQIAGVLRDSAHEPVQLVALAAGETARRSVRDLLGAARAVLADRIEERLPAIDQPTVVVHAERDGLVSREWAETVTALLPHGRLVVVPSEAHAIPFTHPHLVAEIVRELIAQECE